MAGLAMSASHLSIWTIGICAGVYFLQEFETQLKPLVVSFVFVSILEAVVQMLEWVFQKSWTLLKLLLGKMWLLFGMGFLKICRCNVEQEDYDEMWHDVLYNWSDLLEKWRGSDAGRYFSFRFLSVCLTLMSVGLVALYAKTLVEQEVSAVINKFDLYRHQVTSMANAVQNFLPELEKSVPRQFQNQTAIIVQTFEDNFDKTMEELPEKVQGIALWVLNSIVATSSARLMDLAFFLLYSAFMLFDPLHINLEDPVDSKDESPASHSDVRTTYTQGWLTRTSGNFAENIIKRIQSGRFRVRSVPAPVVEPLLSQAEAGSLAMGNGAATVEETQSAPAVVALPEQDGGRQLIGLQETPNLPEAIPERHASEVQPGVQRQNSGGIQLNELQYYIYKIVWSYFLITVFLNVAFATSVFFLLQSLAVDLAVIISVTTFFFSFIPEVGAILSAVLPIPFILLTPTVYCKDAAHDAHSDYWKGVDKDCIEDMPLRFHRVLAAIVGMFLIKLVVSNLLSAFLMGRSKVLAGSFSPNDKEVRETHGVIVLFAVVFFGKVWGIVGMLISVPILSIVRLTLNMGSDYHRQKAEQTAKWLREEEARESRERKARRYRSDSQRNIFQA